MFQHHPHDVYGCDGIFRASRLGRFVPRVFDVSRNPSASHSPILSKEAYQAFLNSPSSKQWRRIAVKRRAGAAIPLFSIYSEKSVGIGDFFDLKLLVDWVRLCGMSLVQLLPLNDVGFDFGPYDAQSSFALEPVHLSLERLNSTKHVFREELSRLKVLFPTGGKGVDYGIKKAKLNFLWEVFQASTSQQLNDFDS